MVNLPATHPVVSSSHLFLFLASAALLAVSPGPGMLYVLARTLRGGRRVGMASSLGTAAGGLAHVVAAAFGLSAVLARSASAFLVCALLQKSADVSGLDQTCESVGTSRSGSPFWQGVATEVLNPKTALFFLAFIPQFVSHDAPLVPQFISLGVISVVLNTGADIVIVLLAGPLQERLASSGVWRRRQQQATGIALIGLGGYVGAGSQ